MRNFVLFILFVVMLVLAGHFGLLNEADDAKAMAEFDGINKQMVIQDWEHRCSTGDIFDAQVCKSVMKGE